MDPDEHRDREPEAYESQGKPPSSDEPSPDRPPRPSRPGDGTAVVATTDAVVTDEAEQGAEWKRHPDATAVVETNQAEGPVPVYLKGVRTAVVEDRPAAGPPPRGRDRDDRHGRERARRREDSERDEEEDDERPRPRRRDDERRPAGSLLSGPTGLLITGAVALVCGLVGA